MIVRHKALSLSYGSISAVQELYVPVAKLMSLDYKKHNIPELCLQQLECDLLLLSKVIGRSIDEAVLTVHIILQNILQKSPPPGAVIKSNCTAYW